MWLNFALQRRMFRYKLFTFNNITVNLFMGLDFKKICFAFPTNSKHIWTCFWYCTVQHYWINIYRDSGFVYNNICCKCCKSVHEGCWVFSIFWPHSERTTTTNSVNQGFVHYICLGSHSLRHRSLFSRSKSYFVIDLPLSHLL